MSVALVLVSHSAGLALGLAELAGQMAPDVAILPAGGMADGGLGTSFDAVLEAVESVTEGGGSAVVLTDLGSAVLTADSVLETLDDDVAARVRLADAPFVEGAVAAAVAAQGGGGLDAVVAAAEGAAGSFAGAAEAAAPSADGALTRKVTLRNRLGLHARPAALLSRTVPEFDAEVTVDGVDARSVLQLMTLGATGGHELTVVARGPQADEALAAVVALVEDGFGEE